jgi:ankyrin repeat protein
MLKGAHAVRKRLILAGMMAALTLAGPASAQFSDSYNFLKAVRSRSEDGKKAMDLMSKPGSVIIDTRDITTGETALHIVMKDRDLPWINFLLSKGARPDQKDAQGNTPLMIATQLRFPEGITALLRYRANVDLAASGGETPLIRAVQMRDPTMVRLLLVNGANPDKADTAAGYTARDYAKRDPRGAAILKIFDEVKPKPKVVSGPKL